MNSIEVNKYQTPLTEELLDSLNSEVREQLLDFINNVEFIKNLISPNRKYARDLPRDEKGRIIVDICNPHILEDMEYFRPAGNHYKKYGTYTDLRPNRNPRSEYGKWFAEEIRRCQEGYVRESDGEWVTGFEYFYLNYEPIIQIKQIGNRKQANRVTDFPRVWEGVHFVFHYLDQARWGGLYDDFVGGKHGVEIARRGASKSYILAGMLARTFLLGENKEACKKTRGIITAYDKEKLTKDGSLNKFTEIIDFCADNTQFPRKRLQDSLDKMTWKLGYKDLNTGSEKGRGNVVLGVTAKDNVEKCHPYSCNVPTPDGIKKWGDIQVGDYIFSEYGNPIKVLQTFERDEDDIYKIVLKDGRVTYATKDHLWEIIYRAAGKFKSRIVETGFMIGNTVRCDKNYTLCKWGIKKAGCVQFPEREVEIEPYVMGLFLGDGCSSKCRGDNLNITMLPEDMKECSTHYSYDTAFSRYGKDITHFIKVPKVRKKLGKYGLAYSNHSNKFIPKDYLFNSEQNRWDLLNGLLDSDGSCTKDYGVIEYSTKSITLRDDFIYLVRSLGINAKWSSKIVNNETYYRCYVYSNDSRLFNLQRKKDRLKVKLLGYSRSFTDKTHIVSVEYSHRERCKCVLVDNPTHLYLIDDFIVTHNSRGKRAQIFGYEEFGAFKKFIDIWNVNRPSVEEGDIAYGLAFAIGTGGTQGSDFSGALEIIYNPKGYNVYAIPNVFDKVNSAKQNTVFFFGAYLNLAGHYNNDGVSDVIGALIQILNNRFTIKYNSSDPMSVTRHKAENPITIQEAIMKRDSTIYPIADLTDRLNVLDADSHAYDNVYVGDLGMDNDYPFPKTGPEYSSIRNFPHKDNKLRGAIEFYKMPERDSKGEIMSNRFYAGVDPYDDDTSDSLSLGSIVVWDSFTDQIVCEYTGRPDFADEFYEICRRILLFYNAKANYENNKKGLYKYFSQTNSLYLLTDTLTFLKDRDDVAKVSNNKSKGTQATAPVKRYARNCIREWLNKPIPIQSEDPEEETIYVKQLTKLQNRALILELIGWNEDGNFDRHDALGMCMLLREEILRLSGGDPESSNSDPDPSDKAHDDFFERNFKKSMERKEKRR